MEKNIKQKKCPKCARIYVDETLNYCLADGSFLYFPEELAEKATDAATELFQIQAETVEMPAEVPETPTVVKNSVATLVIPKTEPSFPPEISPVPEPITTDQFQLYTMIGAGVIGLLIISGIIYFSRTVPDTPSTLSSNSNLAATTNSIPTLSPVNMNNSISNVASIPSNMSETSSNMRNTMSNIPDTMSNKTDTFSTCQQSSDQRILDTNWKASENGDNYRILFLDKCELYYKGDTVDSQDDKWTMEGEKVILYLNNNHARCEGVFNEKRIKFSCRNKYNNTWDFTAIRTQ